MNKSLIQISIASIVGLCIGYLVFGTDTNAEVSSLEKDHIHNQEESWTCSMHPQIVQSEEGDCPICGMDLTPMSAISGTVHPEEFTMTKNAVALANIQTTKVGNRIAKGALILSGKITADESTNTIQASYFTGRIEKLFVNTTGERITKGQKLAVIYAPELIAAQQELLTAASVKETQPQLYTAVRNKLRLWKLSDAQVNAIEEAGRIQEKFPIFATVSGIVTHKISEEGDYVKQGHPLFNVSNLNTVWAEFDAYENQIRVLQDGQHITIQTNAYPDQKFETKLTFIDPQLNSATRTVKVRAVLKNKNNMFKPGMFVKGSVTSIESNTDQNITIPTSAILWTGKRSIVYVKTKPDQPVFEMREVTLGSSGDDYYTILGGLALGDEVVTNGTFTVDAAAQLQGKKSMMNQ